MGLLKQPLTTRRPAWANGFGECVPHSCVSSCHTVPHPRAGKSCDFKMFFPLPPLSSQAMQEIEAISLLPLFS